MGWICRTQWEAGNAYPILVRQPEVKRPSGRPSYRWGIILKWKMEIKCEDASWIQVAPGRF